ncbi:DUF998 domain-containing protein [Streptomyces sp. NPDC051172]|uniref:DUF998 domain-containing protein n=1 Tax=Streptomyces sp. NPDC051172 TaxID=3155796 RepID=UPI00342A47FA
MIGALAYSSFVLEAFLHTGLSPLRSYVSELSVADRPYAFLFRAGDVTAGCCLLALAMALARRLPATRGRACGCVALAVTAVASIGDGLWPMPCAPSVDPVCRATDSADLDQQLGQIHTLSSLAEFTGAILAMLLLSKVLQRTGHRRPARWSLRAGVATAALGALEIAMALTGVRWVGLPERAQVVLVSAWCAAMARFLRRIRGFPLVGGHLRSGPAGDRCCGRSRLVACFEVASGGEVSKARALRSSVPVIFDGDRTGRAPRPG